MKRNKILQSQYVVETQGMWSPPSYTEWLENKVLEKKSQSTANINPYSAREVSKLNKKPKL